MPNTQRLNPSILASAPPPNSKNKSLRIRRLLRHADFDRVYKQGKRYFAPHMTVFYVLRNDGESEQLRIGFTVGKSLGGAVQRNRMKRRLREAVRLNGLNKQLAADLVINPKHSLLQAKFADLREEIAKAFEVIEKQEKQNRRA